MSGGSLPRTGAGLVLGSIGGFTFGLPQVGMIALGVGIVIVVLSAVSVKVGWRRKKNVGQA